MRKKKKTEPDSNDSSQSSSSSKEKEELSSFSKSNSPGSGKRKRKAIPVEKGTRPSKMKFPVEGGENEERGSPSAFLGIDKTEKKIREKIIPGFFRSIDRFLEDTQDQGKAAQRVVKPDSNLELQAKSIQRTKGSKFQKSSGWKQAASMKEKSHAPEQMEAANQNPSFPFPQKASQIVPLQSSTFPIDSGQISENDRLKLRALDMMKMKFGESSSFSEIEKGRVGKSKLLETVEGEGSMQREEEKKMGKKMREKTPETRTKEVVEVQDDQMSNGNLRETKSCSIHTADENKDNFREREERVDTDNFNAQPKNSEDVSTTLGDESKTETLGIGENFERDEISKTGVRSEVRAKSLMDKGEGKRNKEENKRKRHEEDDTIQVEKNKNPEDKEEKGKKIQEVVRIQENEDHGDVKCNIHEDAAKALMGLSYDPKKTSSDTMKDKDFMNEEIESVERNEQDESFIRLSEQRVRLKDSQKQLEVKKNALERTKKRLEELRSQVKEMEEKMENDLREVERAEDICNKDKEKLAQLHRNELDKLNQS